MVYFFKLRANAVLLIWQCRNIKAYMINLFVSQNKNIAKLNYMDLPNAQQPTKDKEL